MTFRLSSLMLTLFTLLFVACGPSDDPAAAQIADGPERPGDEEGIPMGAEEEIFDDDMDGLFYDDLIIDLDDVTPALRLEIRQLVATYLDIKNALVKDDITVARQYAKGLRNGIHEFNIDNIPAGGMPLWRRAVGDMEEPLEEMVPATDMSEFRRQFSYLSRAMANLTRQFGLAEGELYLYHCPEALNGTGAFWISEARSGDNPYFGPQNPNCANLKDSFMAVVE